MLIKGNYKVLCASSSVFQLLPVLKDWFQICPKTDFQVPTMLEKRAPYLRTLSLAGIRETCRDGGPCCCLLIPSCAGRASWGGVHLGCFNGAVDAVSASVLDVLLNSFILSDPATLHTLPFRFSDPDKLGWVVCSGVFLLGWFYVGLGFFFPIFLGLVSPWKCLEFHGHLERLVWRSALLRAWLGFSTRIFLTVHLHTPFLFHVFLKPRISGEGLCV